MFSRSLEHFHRLQGRSRFSLACFPVTCKTGLWLFNGVGFSGKNVVFLCKSHTFRVLGACKTICRRSSSQDRPRWAKIAEDGLKIVLRSSKTRKCCILLRKTHIFQKITPPQDHKPAWQDTGKQRQSCANVPWRGVKRGRVKE